jgi:MoaA/NifB/PqqE/SkfB family radical SAM enzyme/glycosyltransferase involved in cell wall biosynthesis
MPKLSVVIPCYQSTQLSQCLGALDKELFQEIVIVDSSPEPILAGFKDTGKESHASVRYIRSATRLLPGAARNLGAKLSTQDFLLFVDADVALSKAAQTYVGDWIHSETNAAPSTVMVGVYATDDSEGGSLNRLNNKIIEKRLTQYNQRNAIRYGLASHMLVSKKTFDAIGGFNESAPVLEDIGFCILAQALGYTVAFESRFAAHHKKFFNAGSLIVDYFKRAFSVTFYSADHPFLFKKKKNQIPAAWILCWAIQWSAGMASLLAPWGPIYQSIAIVLVMFSPCVLLKQFYSTLSSEERAYWIALWPWMGMALVAGTLSGKLAVLFKSLLQNMKGALHAISVLKKLAWQNGLPVSLIHFLTARCNLRCKHCFYKETLNAPTTGELSKKKLTSVFQQTGALAWYSVGGGEPFLRTDIAEVLTDVSYWCKPWILSIPSNGWYTQKTVTSVRRLLEACPNQTLLLNFSVDGDETTHDQVRGKGSWARLQETQQTCRALARLYKNLRLGVITVVNRENYREFPHLIDKIATHFAPEQISVNLERFPQDREYRHAPQLLQAYKGSLQRVSELFGSGSMGLHHWTRIPMQWREWLQKKIILAVAEENEFSTPCKAGTLLYVIWEDGRVAPCEMLDVNIGNSGEGTLNDIYRSPAAAQLRKKITSEKCKCTYECAATMTALSSPKYWLRSWMELETKFGWPALRVFSPKGQAALLNKDAL